jgi:integrase
MASLTKDNRLLFRAADGKRKTLRLGGIPRKQAAGIQRHVEILAAAQIDGSAPPPATSQWIRGLSDGLRDKLQRVGLVAPVEAAATCPTLGELIEAFRDRPKWRQLKPATHHAYDNAFHHIRERFGAETLITDVVEIAAEELPSYLMEAKPNGAGLAKASAYRICDSAVMLFRFAIKARLLDRNPFDEVARGVIPTSRRALVGADVYEAVLAELHDTQTRLTFALARWGALRTPSEPRLLRWGDIDWERERFLVHSEKTAHHHGLETRWVPMFPELARLFDERYTDAAAGDELVLPMLSAMGDSGFRGRLTRAVVRAGLEPWPRICHALRSTRQTELAQSYPAYVVEAWCGCSERTAVRHYLQLTEDHFEQAAKSGAHSGAANVRRDGKRRETAPGGRTGEVAEVPDIPADSDCCPTLRETPPTRDMKRLISL